MSIFSRWFGVERKSDSLTVDQLAERLQLRQRTTAGESVTPANAMRSPTIFAIVNALSRTLAQLPVDIIKSAGGERIEQPEHELAWLLNKRPNGWQTRYDYWFTVGAQLVLYGEFIALKNQAGNGRIINLIPVPPGQATAALNADMAMEYEIQLPTGERRSYGQRQVHHIRLGTVDGVTPIRPIDNIRESIGLEIAAEKFGAQLFGDGAIPNLVIEHPSHFLDGDSQKRFGDSWNAAFRKKRGTAVLEDGMKVTPIQLTNEESQFLETRKYQRTVIAGAFGIPPHRIGDLERATFSNIEQQSLEFVVYALMPYLVAIESAAHRDLLPEPQKTDTTVKFNVDALLRGDALSRAEALAIERQNGVISANEWRSLTDRNKRTDPGGDEYITPMNMTGSNAPPKDGAPPPKDTPVGGPPPGDPPPGAKP